ncbi:MAG: metallophosphoesterase family protein [Candidatus Bathyarchaeota archaeon]|nr:metallophosphoesterase family protein [Candidatus Bathyarchaeota archaeon]
MKEKYTIAHISDVHVGEGGFRQDQVIKSVQEINELSPDLVVVTGDLTYNGLDNEFKLAKRLLNRLNKKPLVVMGNHDARNVGYLLFEKYFGERMVEYEDDDVFLIGIDSTQPDIDGGHVGREEQSYIERTLSNAPKNKVKIFMLHHHLLPIPMAGREQNILDDAGEVLKNIVNAGVDLVLCGHRHIPWTWKVENMYIIHSGTVGSPRTKQLQKHSYVVIEIKQNGLTVNLKPVGLPERRLRAGDDLY